MNVSDVLELPSFSGAKVIAGASGLSNEVSTAMVLEATDIEAWGREGQILITSFYALEGLSDEGLDAFFEQSSEIGISAIVFKPERLLSSPPSRLIELCESTAIPLILVERDTTYESLMLDVLGHVLDSNLTLLNRFFDVHRQLMSFALEQPSILQILMRLHGIIHSDVTFFDATEDRRIATDPDRSSFSSVQMKKLSPDRYRSHAYFDSTLTYRNGIVEAATAVRIPSSDDRDYYLVIHAKSHGLRPIDIMAVENVVSLMQMEILKQNAVDRKLFFRNNNLVHNLLLGRYTSPEEASSTLEALNLKRYPDYEVLLIRADPDDPVNSDRMEDIFDMIRRRIGMLYPDFAFFESNDRIVLLHNVRNDSARFDPRAIREILSDLAESKLVPSFAFLAVLSGTGAADVIPSLNKQALDMCRFFDTDRYRGDCLRFDDLGIYRILMQVGDVQELQKLVDPRVSSLREQNRDLFDTAVELCENNLNFQETARQLFAHPKTIRYRNGRIRELFKLDLHNPDDRLQIELGNRIFRLVDAQR